jgi:hypothetical protein
MIISLKCFYFYALSLQILNDAAMQIDVILSRRIKMQIK